MQLLLISFNCSILVLKSLPACYELCTFRNICLFSNYIHILLVHQLFDCSCDMKLIVYVKKTVNERIFRMLHISLKLLNIVKRWVSILNILSIIVFYINKKFHVI